VPHFDILPTLPVIIILLPIFLKKLTDPEQVPFLTSKNILGNFPSGEQTVYEQIISNEGYAQTGPLSIVFPETSGFILLSPSVIPSLLPGESYSIYYLITPNNLKRAEDNSTIINNIIIFSEDVFLSTKVQIEGSSPVTENVGVFVVDEIGKF
jgi:hypothetical protein